MGMLAGLVSQIGNSLPRPARRLLLDRLGGARVVGWIAAGSFVEATLTNSVKLSANPAYHGGLIKAGRIDYESNVTALLNERLGQGTVIYDIGANIGVFTFLAALRAGPTGAVVAFEPEPNNIVCLRRSMERNEAPAPISLLEVAVSDNDGFVTFDRRGGAFSGRIVNDETKDGAAAATLEVPSRSLDSLVEDGDTPPPDFIKIDVEGGEGAVLSGARRTLTTHRPEILLEMHHFAKSGVERAYAVLDEQGYRLHLVDNFSGGEPPVPTRSERAQARHILAVPS